MLNIFRSKKDLKLIKQLEQTIGKKLTKLDNSKRYAGYVQNKHNKITRLSLYRCGLKELPPEIVNLQNLTELDLMSNQLSTLPAEIANLQNLTKLYLGENQFRSLPAEIANLQNLTKLYLGDNQLSTLPAEIRNLQNLTGLTLSKNQLSSLPAEIGNLQNLTELYLWENQFRSLPAEIGNLQNLTWLHLPYNHLSSLPPEIGKLQNLTWLDLSENQLNQFPKALLDLNLEVKWPLFWAGTGIIIRENSFQIPPVEIVKQGRQAIIDYYAALEEQPECPLNESKLILIGDGAAGKTSLMKHLLGLDFDPQESQTHGININTLNLKDNNNNEIKLHCWDFGGQQIMHATHQFFLSKRCLYLLVIDSRRETQVDYWLKHIQSFGKNSPVIIVINKIDENPHFHLPQQSQLKQRYPNLKHINRISCTTKAGISELNNTIQNTLSGIELLNTPFPEKWFKVKTAIAEQAKKTNFTSFEHYIDICQTNGISKETEQNTLINFLHDLGLINHFQDPRLRETYVINPQWLTEAVYTIITAPKLAGNGKLHRNDLKSLLNNETYPERKHDYILELMKKFELCYVLNDKEYLLPDLFPTQEPDFEFDAEHALHFILKYEFLPKSIFTRFIVRMHRQILNNSYWRNGILLRDSNTTALIETDSDSLILQISGPKKREYLAILLFILKDINRSFSHLKVTEKIGLPDNPQLSVNHDYLLKLAANGHSEYLPENSDKSYKISELLGIVAPASETEVMQMLYKIVRILETQGIEKEKDLFDHIDEVVKVNPGLFGVSVDVNALVRKMFKK